MSLVLRPAPERTTAQNIGRIVVCSVLTAACARLAFRLPFTPVPATCQVIAVLFSGLMLGARAAFFSQLLYLLAGLAGAPVFAFGNGGALYLFNSYGTGGYLLSCPLAAYVTGLLADRLRAEHTHRLRTRAPFIACAGGLGVIYCIGCLWLGFWRHLPPLQTVLQGAGWFLCWDIVKALIAIAADGALKRHEGEER